MAPYVHKVNEDCTFEIEQVENVGAIIRCSFTIVEGSAALNDKEEGKAASTATDNASLATLKEEVEKLRIQKTELQNDYQNAKAQADFLTGQVKLKDDQI